MRLWLILLVGLLCVVMTSCPAPEDEYANEQTAIDDEGMRQPEFAEEETATTDGEEAVVCEVCGQDPCACGDTAVEGEEGTGEDEGEAVEGDEGAGEEEEPAEDGEEEPAEPEGDDPEEGEA